MTKEIPILSKEGDAKGRSYYGCGQVNFIDLLYNALPHEQFRGFCKANAIKYIFRYDKKHGKEDLEKAKQYLAWLKELEG